MVRVLRSCIQSILKLVNSLIGMAGLAMILYSAWMIRVWQRQMGELPFGHDSDYPAPWFIYTFLGLGVTFCVITLSGHVAAETANGCCLYLYMVFVVLVIMLEAAISIDVFLNRDWEKDFPDDPSGNFDQFKNFIRSNFEMCKWIGLSLVSVQGLSLLLAMILKALGPHQYYDSDDEYALDRVPLLKNAPPYVLDPGYGHGPKNEAWVRINDKVIHCFKLNLDILSHGKTSETMLFFMSVGLVKDLSAEDGLAIEMMAMEQTSAYLTLPFDTPTS